MIDKLNIKKGDVFLASLNPIIGSEQSGTRPVVIVQNNKGNKHSPTVLVAPITSKINNKKNLPTHVFIKAFAGVKYDSTILIEQCRVIDKKRLKSYIGTVGKNIIKEIDIALIEGYGIEVEDGGIKWF